jgi:hypothetical protein
MPSRSVLKPLLLAAAVAAAGPSALRAGTPEMYVSTNMSTLLEVGFQKGNSDNAVVKIYIQDAEDPAKGDPQYDPSSRITHVMVLNNGQKWGDDRLETSAIIFQP